MFAFGGGSKLGKEDRLQDTFRNTFGNGVQDNSFEKNPNTSDSGQDPGICQEEYKVPGVL